MPEEIDKQIESGLFFVHQELEETSGGAGYCCFSL